MKVIQTIQSNRIDAGAPVEVSFYTGPYLAEAIAAAASAAVGNSEYYNILSVRIDFDA